MKDVERPDLDHGKDIRILSLEFLNQNIALYENQDKVKFKIIWESQVSDEYINMYIPLKYADSTPVGLAESKSFRNKGIGTVNETIFEFDISNLADGKYYFLIDFFVKNQFGAHRSYDHPNESIYFEVARNRNARIEWQRKYWGSIYLNQIEIMREG